MRVATYYNNNDIRIEERPKPKIGKGELLIRVEASGICGSDVMEWYRIHRAPLILGHEVAGVITEVGQGIAHLKAGQRVAVAHHVPCGVCRYCKDGHESVCDTLRATNFDPGGFAEYVRLPQINVASGVFLLPDAVSFEEATFVEPLACIIRAQRMAGMRPGKNVLVLGSGIAGLLHIAYAKTLGAGVIVATDISEYRLKAAGRLGAQVSVHAKDYSVDILRVATKGKGADLVIVSVGSASAIAQALESVERGGVVLFFAPSRENAAIPIPFNNLFWRNEITLTSSYAGSPAEYQEALEMIAQKKIPISAMITHRMPLAQTGDGFKLVAEGNESIKVIVFPQQ